MCGISGFYAFDTQRGRSDLHAIAVHMNTQIAHRGPDSADIWQDPDVPLLLGHRRLAILDLSTQGHQPKPSISGRYMVAYNGEIYNHLDLRKDLEKAGHEFSGRSDTETLLTAIEHWGLNLAVQKINGMFAFVLWDRKERVLHLVRDRMGKKPLYVGWAGRNFAFASELKSLTAHPDFNKEINQQSLASYMQNGYVQAPHSIYRNVWSVPAGCRMALDFSALDPAQDLSPMMEPYWHHLRAIEDARSRPLEGDDAQITEQFESLLKHCVSDRMLSDVPLGAFLSGGIDSSAVVAMMQANSTRKVKTYTIGFAEAGFNEAEYAKDVAKHLGTDHHELYLSGDDALGVVPKLPEIYDEPFADISAIPTYLVSEFARRDVTVALSGDGGDEMLGGYNRHVSGPALWNKIKPIPKPMRGIAAAAIGAINIETWDKILPFRPQSGTAMHKVAAVLRHSQSEDHFYRRLLSQSDHTVAQNPDKASLLMDQDRWRSDHLSLSFAERMMYLDALGYLPNDVLVKVDRATMAVALEARAPLLDRRIYDFVWRLPAHYKIRDGQGKWLLRQVLRRYIPAHLFERPKQGFSIPVGAWLRQDLRDWAEGLLDPQTLQAQGDLNVQAVRAMWQDHLKGQGSHSPQLWTVLMYQAWRKHWL